MKRIYLDAFFFYLRLSKTAFSGIPASVRLREDRTGFDIRKQKRSASNQAADIRQPEGEVSNGGGEISGGRGHPGTPSGFIKGRQPRKEDFLFEAPGGDKMETRSEGLITGWF